MTTGEWIWDGYRPGVTASLIALQMGYYKGHWDFGRTFEAKLAEELGAFLARYDPDRHLFLNAFVENSVLKGSITIDDDAGAPGLAHLRWFMVAEDMRGRGLGKELLGRAVAFCRDRDYGGIYLTTFAGLHAARTLYERAGFGLADESEKDPWSGTVGLQRFELDLGDAQ